MANYYNPYLSGGYPIGYSANSYQAPVSQSYASVPSTGTPIVSNILGYQVDGEVGAKGFPMPNGATGPVALWDMNDSVFYLRTFNQAGFPNPLEKYRFVKEETTQALPSGQSGADQSQTVNRNEFEQLSHKIDELAGSIRNLQNQNAGGNRNANNNGRQG